MIWSISSGRTATMSGGPVVGRWARRAWCCGARFGSWPRRQPGWGVFRASSLPRPTSKRGGPSAANWTSVVRHARCAVVSVGILMPIWVYLNKSFSSQLCQPSFFKRPAQGLVADRLDEFQRHGLFGQEPQRPVGESCRRPPQPQGDDLGFLRAVENLAARPALRFAIDRDLEAFGHQAFSKVLHG